MWVLIVALCLYNAHHVESIGDYIALNGEPFVTSAHPYKLYRYTNGELIKLTCHSTQGHPYFPGWQAQPQYSNQSIQNHNSDPIYLKLYFHSSPHFGRCVLNDRKPIESLKVIFAMKKKEYHVGFQVNGMQLHPNVIRRPILNFTYEYYPGEKMNIKTFNNYGNLEVTFRCTVIGLNVILNETNEQYGTPQELDLNLVGPYSSSTSCKFITCVVSDALNLSDTLITLKLNLDTFAYSPSISGLSLSKILMRRRYNETTTKIFYMYISNEILELSCSAKGKPIIYDLDSHLIPIRSYALADHAMLFQIRMMSNVSSANLSCWYIEHKGDINYEVRTHVTLIRADGYEKVEKFFLNFSTSVGKRGSNYTNSTTTPTSTLYTEVTSGNKSTSQTEGRSATTPILIYTEHGNKSKPITERDSNQTISANPISTYTEHGNKSKPIKERGSNRTTSTTPLSTYTEHGNKSKPITERGSNDTISATPISTYTDSWNTIIICLAVLFIIALVTAMITCLKARCERKALENNISNQEVDNVSRPSTEMSEHIYETVSEEDTKLCRDAGSTGTQPSAHKLPRPPQPLPPEEENAPYIHYDTPYELRIFRIGVPVIDVPSRFKKTCRRV